MNYPADTSRAVEYARWTEGQRAEENQYYFLGGDHRRTEWHNVGQTGGTNKKADTQFVPQMSGGKGREGERSRKGIRRGRGQVQY